MAKKKSSKANRKHQFKYAAPSTAVVAPSAKQPAGSPTLPSAAAASQRDFSYVAVDLRRIALLGGSLVVFEFVLWYIFNHTGLGPAVYNLVKL
jgi:hypothetical protein